MRPAVGWPVPASASQADPQPVRGALTALEALRLVMAHVDHGRGACRATDAVVDVLPDDVLAVCREVLAANGSR